MALTAPFKNRGKPGKQERYLFRWMRLKSGSAAIDYQRTLTGSFAGITRVRNPSHIR